MFNRWYTDWISRWENELDVERMKHVLNNNLTGTEESHGFAIPETEPDMIAD